MKNFWFATAVAACLATAAHAQEKQDQQETDSAFGGQSGADLSIEAMEPTEESIGVGLAGEDPANIARYLLASGARGAQLGPDGAMLAFSWSITGEPQLWAMHAEGGQPRRLTFGSGITFFRWSPDGTRLIYGADNDGNEQPAFYSIAADGSEERVILPAAEGGFRAFGDFAGEDIVYASTERNGLDFDIWRKTPDGEAELVYKGEFAFYARAVSPGGRHVVVTESVGEDSDNLHLLDLETGEIETLSEPDPRANHGDAGFVWAPDGSGFYFATNRDREYPALMFHEMESGESRVIAEPGVTIGDLALCGANDNYLVWTENRDGFHSVMIRNLDSENETVPAPRLPEGVYGLDCADAPTGSRSPSTAGVRRATSTRSTWLKAKPPGFLPPTSPASIRTASFGPSRSASRHATAWSCRACSTFPTAIRGQATPRPRWCSTSTAGPPVNPRQAGSPRCNTCWIAALPFSSLTCAAPPASGAAT